MAVLTIGIVKPTSRRITRESCASSKRSLPVAAAARHVSQVRRRARGRRQSTKATRMLKAQLLATLCVAGGVDGRGARRRQRPRRSTRSAAGRASTRRATAAPTWSGRSGARRCSTNCAACRRIAGRARFVCVLVLIEPDREPLVATGSVDGLHLRVGARHRAASDTIAIFLYPPRGCSFAIALGEGEERGQPPPPRRRRAAGDAARAWLTSSTRHPRDEVRAIARRRRFDDAGIRLALEDAERGTVWVARDDARSRRHCRWRATPETNGMSASCSSSRRIAGRASAHGCSRRRSTTPATPPYDAARRERPCGRRARAAFRCGAARDGAAVRRRDSARGRAREDGGGPVSFRSRCDRSRARMPSGSTSSIARCAARFGPRITAHSRATPRPRIFSQRRVRRVRLRVARRAHRSARVRRRRPISCRSSPTRSSRCSARYGASWCSALVPGSNRRIARTALRAGLQIERNVRTRRRVAR